MKRRSGPRAAGVFTLLAACVLLAGCETGQPGYTPKWYVQRTRAPLVYDAIRQKYNERCEGLYKLRCPANLTIESPGEHAGDRRTDQVEANLQFVAPMRIALRVDKLGNTMAYLGCDEIKY